MPGYKLPARAGVSPRYYSDSILPYWFCLTSAPISSSCSNLRCSCAASASVMIHAPRTPVPLQRLILPIPRLSSYCPARTPLQLQSRSGHQMHFWFACWIFLLQLSQQRRSLLAKLPSVCLRSAFDGIFPRGSRRISACAGFPGTGRIRDAPESVSTLVRLISDNSCRGLDCASRSATSCDPTLCVPASIHGRPTPSSVHRSSLRWNAVSGISLFSVSCSPGGSLRSSFSSSWTGPPPATPVVLPLLLWKLFPRLAIVRSPCVHGPTMT